MVYSNEDKNDTVKTKKWMLERGFNPMLNFDDVCAYKEN